MIFFLAGTSDARELALIMKKKGYNILTTVVTENAARNLRESGLAVHVGRLSKAEMLEMIENTRAKMVLDASHPFAEVASINAKAAANAANIPYVRYERERQMFHHDKIVWVENYEEAAERVREKQGVVMLTTGSKTLPIFTEKIKGCSNIRLVARMLPRKDNMEKCEALGVVQKNIVAMQGPFSKSLNKALYEHYGVTLMVTKESGKVGAVDEKITAAIEMGIEVIVIKRPNLFYDIVYSDFKDILLVAEQIFHPNVAGNI